MNAVLAGADSEEWLAATTSPGEFVTKALLPLILFIALVVLIIRWANKRQRAKWQRDADQLAAWAAAHGWTYEAERPDLFERWRNRVNWETGADQRVKNYISGHYRDRVVAACEYTFYDRDPDGGGGTVHVTVCALPLPMTLPGLRLYPESIVSTVARKLGVHDIEIGPAEFDQAWSVRSDDEAFAKAVLTPPLQQILMASDFPRRSFSLAGSDLVVWRRGKPDPEALGPLFDALIAIADAIPGWVWTAYGQPA
ncbi:MAG: hypothetical protein LBR27_09510 [Bifidobacteriaceae bacterium]|jgi:hypothetical protein|nr:hypothetical protein [Bifidobacteriaceae bacterium]